MKFEDEFFNEGEDQENKQSLDEIKKQAEKDKVSKLYEQLEKIQEKLSNQELSPLKRFLLENKLSIIEIRLERQLAKLDMREYKEEYEESKNELYDDFNEKLKVKNNELEDIFEEIELQERKIEQKMSRMKDRDADYKEINSVRTGRKLEKNSRSVYQFKATEKVDNALQKQQKELEKLKAKKDLKKEEIINFKKEFIENEKMMDSQIGKEIKEYKPSLWQSFKTIFLEISDNFISWRNSSKQEKEAVRNAKREARTNARIDQSIESNAQNRERMEDFKGRVNYHNPLEEQKEYSERTQEELERVRGEVIENPRQEK